MYIKISTPAIAKRTTAIAAITIISSVLLFPLLPEEAELVADVVVSEVVVVEVAVTTCVVVTEAVGEDVAKGFAAGPDVADAAVMVRCLTPVV
jgi:hypothetical protein